FNCRLTVAIPITLLVSIGLLLNIVLWRIISIQKDLIESSFKRHVISLIAANIGEMTSSEEKFALCLGFNITLVCTTIPISFFHVEYPDWLLITLSTPNSFFYQVILYANFAIAFDRFLMFVLQKIHHCLTGIKHYILIILPWLVAGWNVGHSTFIGCYKRFNPFLLRFQYGCSNCPFFLDLNTYLAIYLPVVIFVLYLSIFASIVRKKFSLGSEILLQNRDFTFVLQFFIITMIQLAGNLLFYVDFSNEKIVESLIRLSASTLTTYSNPIVMFAFQQRIRRSFLQWGKRFWLFDKDLIGLRPTRLGRKSTTNV
ncbi:hypothetical protein PFISCL1PPCAC_18828, partial [Pristionchus fissidentatus]